MYYIWGWDGGKIGITFWNLKYMGVIMIKQKVIKYKKDFLCYLSILLKPSYQA